MNQVEVKRRQIQNSAYIVGLVTILIFGSMIGDSGIAYLGAAYEIFSLLAILLGRNVSDALGRMLRGRAAKGQYRNIFRARSYVMLFQAVIGLCGALILLFGGNFLMKGVLHMPHGAVLTAILAPAFFLRMISEVFLGYFQGEGTEMPTALTTVLRQFLLLCFGFLILPPLKGYGEKVSTLLANEDFASMYGAMGVAVAFLLAELITLLLLMVMYRKGSRRRRGNELEGMRITDSFGSVVRILYGNMTGMMLVQLLLRMTVWLGLLCFQKSAGGNLWGIAQYGVYYGKFLVCCMIMVLFADTIILNMATKVISFLRKDELKYAKNGFQAGIHITVVTGMYFAVFVIAMREQLAGILCGENIQPAASLFGCGAFIILFAAVGDYFARILLKQGKWLCVFWGLSVMDVVFAVCLLLFLNFRVGIQSLAYALLAGGAALCLVLGFWVQRQLRMTVEWIYSVLIPAVCACLTGGMCLLLGQAFTPHLGNPVTVIVCLILSLLVYWILLLFLRNVREQELKWIPGGRLIRVIGQMLHLL